jgi:hypothetical protein
MPPKKGRGKKSRKAARVTAMSEAPKHVDQSDWKQVTGAIESEFGGSGLTPQELAAASPEQLGNQLEVEFAWAEKAAKHSETYFGVLRILPDKKKVKLSK